MISWGVAWTNASIVNEYFDFYDLVSLRFFFGALSLIPILLVDKKKFLFKISYLRYLIPASMMFFLYNISFFMGTHYGDPGKGAVFATTTNPIVTLIVMALITRRISRREILGIFGGALGGLLIMNVFWTGFGLMFSMQNIFFPICSFLWGIVTVLISYAQKKIPPFQFIFYCYLITALLSAPFTSIGAQELYSIDFRFCFNFFMVSVASMAFGTSIYMYSTTIIGPVKSSAFIFSVPLIALLAAYFILSEPIYMSTVAGGAICLFSTYIVNKNKD